MRVRITPESKNFMTVNDMKVAHQIIEDCKTEMPIEELAQIAARTATKYNGDFEIFTPTAYICLNGRLNNWYYPNSNSLDVWIEFKAFNSYSGFYIIGAYLTDIHNISRMTADHIRNHMYIRSYKEQERA